MSRSGYTDDIEDNWSHIMWRGRVTSAMRGKRGQALLKTMLAALDAMPEKRLIRNDLACPDGVCALGSLGQYRGMSLTELDPENYEQVAAAFDIAEPLAREIVYMNDEVGWRETPEARWQRMRAWVAGCIKPDGAAA